MDLIQATILGVVQGATEYLPVSSSAHLVLVPAFLGWEKQDEQIHFLFDVLVQLGTLIGVFVYSDPHKDIPLLGLVDNPIAVNCDKVLTSVAEEKGWQVFNWR